MQEHPEQFCNYRNKHDDIGNVMGNVTKTAIYPKVTKARYEVKIFVLYYKAIIIIVL
ncbi:hypothetical protein [Streptococcus pluranimalium]|uniref:hypothetical protein n=1 Tax=Streptococcus pluranimalium TaxID=82348 RepID=UPI0039FDA937